MTIPARIYSRCWSRWMARLTAEFAIRFAADLARSHDADLLLLYLKHLPANPVIGEIRTIKTWGKSTITWRTCAKNSVTRASALTST